MAFLKVGEKVPPFSVTDQSGNLVTEERLKGRKTIIYIYPKDDTPGCTKEACSLRDGYGALRELGFQVFGVSADNASKHQKFINKYQLPFDLLADTTHDLINAFGAWGRKKFMGREYDGILRSTFLIDEEGLVSHVIVDVNTANHADQIMQELKNK